MEHQKTAVCSFELPQQLAEEARAAVAHLPEAAVLDEWVRAVARGAA